MRKSVRCTAGGLAVIGGIALLRPGSRANQLACRRIDQLARELRYLSGKLNGLSYRLGGSRPDPEATGARLADRVRSSLGPLEKKLDIPHVHVMAEGHVVLLHGEVGTQADAEVIEQEVAAISGVRGVESYLHVGIEQGESRPSTGRSVHQPSAARRQLLAAATSAGIEEATAPAVVRAILATFAERIPEDERRQVAIHLPVDVRSLFTPPRRLHEPAPVDTVLELVARIAATSDAVPHERALRATRAVVAELRNLVPEEVADVSAVLPLELRELWQQVAA